MIVRVLVAALAAICWASSNSAADDPPTYTVKQEEFIKYVSLTGNVEATQIVELRADFKHFTTLKVDRVIPDGTHVSVGDVVMWLDTKDFQRQYDLKRLDMEAARLTHEIAELEYRREMEAQQLELAQLRDRLEHLEADRRYYLDVEFPRQIESTQKSQEWQAAYLEDQREELRQLEQMYLEDELVEESEELVLRRTRRSVEQSEFYYEQSRESTRRQLEDILPREFKQREVTFVLEKARLENQIRVGESSQKRRQLQWQKTEMEFANTVRDFEEFAEEGNRLHVTAPASGTFVYGEFDRGALTGARKWRPRDTVNVDQIIGSIVTVGPRRIRADLPEDMSRVARPGQPAVTIPKANSTTHLPGTVQEIGAFPLPSGGFDCAVALVDPDLSLLLAPGSKCDVKIRVLENPQAITVPSKAIFSDDGFNSYVYLKTDRGPERRSVRTGLSENEKTLVENGLHVGDVVLLEKPK